MPCMPRVIDLNIYKLAVAVFKQWDGRWCVGICEKLKYWRVLLMMFKCDEVICMHDARMITVVVVKKQA